MIKKKQLLKIALLLALVLSFFRFFWQLNYEASFFGSVNDAGRVKVWIQSSECAARTGKILVVCDKDGNLTPVESVSIADDRGHNLFLGIFSAISGDQASALTLVKLNILINWLSVIGLSLFLFCSGFQVVGLAWIVTWTFLGFLWKIKGPDVYAISLGLSSMSMLLSFLVYNTMRANSFRRFSTYLISAIFISTICCLMREAVGMISIVSAITIALVTLLLEFNRRRLLYFALIAVSIFCTFRYPTKILLELRNGVYGLKPSVMIPSHGFSHTLFLGLGALDNPWGIMWDDSYADAQVKKVDANVIYCSPKYFSILNRLYFQIILGDPLEVLKVYAKKFSWSWKIILEDKSLKYLIRFSVLALCVFALFFSLNRKAIQLSFKTEGFVVLLIPMILTIGFLSQGVLGYPHYSYLQPSIFSLVMFLFLMDFVLVDTLRSQGVKIFKIILPILRGSRDK